MSGRRSTPGLTSRTAPTANEEFRAAWRARQQWSMAIAVAIHAAVFALLPDWDREELAPGSAADATPLELVAVGADGAPGPAVPASVILSEEEPEEEEQEEEVDNGGRERPAGEGAGGEADAGRGSGADAALEELRRRTASAPGVVEPAPEPERERPEEELRTEPVPADGDDEDEEVGASAPGEDGTRIREGRASLSEGEAAGDDDAPGLDRLSALRPELAFGSPESWILIRNPAEVGTFLRRRFGESEVGSSGPGMLSVAIWVDDGGSVEWAEIDRSSGDPALDESALELFTEVASFRPARKRGARVPLAAIFWLPYPW